MHEHLSSWRNSLRVVGVSLLTIRFVFLDWKAARTKRASTLEEENTNRAWDCRYPDCTLPHLGFLYRTQSSCRSPGNYPDRQLAEGAQRLAHRNDRGHSYRGAVHRRPQAE